MKPKICTVVTGNNLKEFLKNLEKTQQVSEMVELRVDYIHDIKTEDIYTIKNKIKRESIFTCRRSDEGGKFNGNENKRLEVIKKALEISFDFVDIELSSFKNFDYLNNRRCKIILSYHNFEETPDELFLNSIIKKMRQFNPDMIKIATQVNNDSDILKLGKLILNKEMDEKRIIIGMGEKGKVIRIVGPLLGSYLTYASIDKQRSALGQYSLSELQSIYKSII